MRSDSAATKRLISRRAAPRARSTSVLRSVITRIGSASTGRLRNCVRPCNSRPTQLRNALAPRRRRSETSDSSAAASGTTLLAASVGVAARTSATRSHSGLSGSWPIALITGVRQAAIARHRVSSENGNRSSVLPPPRAITITSTSGSESSARKASTICATADVPCTAVLRIAKRTPGQRAAATLVTSCSAAPARPVISPIILGRNGSGRLSRGSNRPSASSTFRNISIRASNSPSPTARIALSRSENAPRRGSNCGLAHTTT